MGLWAKRSYRFYDVVSQTAEPLDGDTIGILVPGFGHRKHMYLAVLHDVIHIVNLLERGTERQQLSSTVRHQVRDCEKQ